MAGTTYSVTVTMSADTVTALTDSGSLLYAFKAVRCSDKSGLPLVWAVTDHLAQNTIVSWTSPYDGYDSFSKIAPGQLVTPGFRIALPVGATLKVTNASGTGDVLSTGTPGACSILNSTTTQFSCGLAQAPADAGRLAFCAFPLFGNNLVTITPLDKVLLMFSTRALVPGTALTSLNMSARRLAFMASTTGGVMIDLDGVTQRSVRYDLNLGWQWDNNTWGTGVAANASLKELLIEPDL
jgi:hypothetical protein